MAEMVREVPWERMNEMNLADSYSFFSANLNRLISACVPKQVAQKKKKNLYMTREALSLKKKKKRLWKKYARTKNIVDHGRFARVRDKLRALTRSLRRDYEKQLAEEVKTNPKAFWRYANSRRKTRTRVEDLKRQDGSMASSEKEKAELLSAFFSSVFTNEDVSVVPQLQTRWTGRMFEDVDITPERVEVKLKALRPTSSPGPDHLHPQVLQEVASPLSVALCMLYAKSMECGQVPEA